MSICGLVPVSELQNRKEWCDHITERMKDAVEIDLLPSLEAIDPESSFLVAPVERIESVLVSSPNSSLENVLGQKVPSSGWFLAKDLHTCAGKYISLLCAGPENILIEASVLSAGDTKIKGYKHIVRDGHVFLSPVDVSPESIGRLLREVGVWRIIGGVFSSLGSEDGRVGTMTHFISSAYDCATITISRLHIVNG